MQRCWRQRAGFDSRRHLAVNRRHSATLECRCIQSKFGEQAADHREVDRFAAM